MIDFWNFLTPLWQDPLCQCSLGTVLVTVLVPWCFASSCLARARPLCRIFANHFKEVLQTIELSPAPAVLVVVALGSSFNHLQLSSFIRWHDSVALSSVVELGPTKSLIAFRSTAPGSSQCCHPAQPRPGHSLPAHSLPAGMLKEKNRINLIGFFFAMLFLYVSWRSVQSWKSHLLAAPCLT